MISKQRGLGLLEVLAASILLAMGAGALYTAQQSALVSQYDSYRSSEALQLAKSYVDYTMQAPNDHAFYYQLLYDNPWAAFIVYQGRYYQETNCFAQVCNGSTGHDLHNLTGLMVANGYRIRVGTCPVNASRGCVYVLWGATTGVNGVGPSQCVNVENGRMVKNPGAQCVVLEGYLM